MLLLDGIGLAVMDEGEKEVYPKGWRSRRFMDTETAMPMQSILATPYTL